MSLPLSIETHEPLPLPGVCLRCGKDTKHKIFIPVFSRDRWKEGLPQEKNDLINTLGVLFPFIHTASWASRMTQGGKEQILMPFCKRCHASMRPVPVKTMLLFSGAIAFFILSIGPLRDDQKWYGWILLFLFFICMRMAIASGKSRKYQFSYPFKVEKENGMYQYNVWDGPFYEYLKAIKSMPKGEEGHTEPQN